MRIRRSVSRESAVQDSSIIQLTAHDSDSDIIDGKG